MGTSIASKSVPAGSAWLARPRVLFLIGGAVAIVLLLLVGYGIWELRSRMESGAAKVAIR